MSRPELGVAVLDQLEAASVDARSWAAEGVDGPLDPVDEMPSPNGRRWDVALRAGLVGCRHLERIEVLYGALSLPGVLLCGDCRLSFLRTVMTEQPDICDGCGGTVPDRLFHKWVTVIGPIVITGSVCPTCIAESNATTD